MSGLTITTLAQQIEDLIGKSEQQTKAVTAWLGGSADGGPNNDGRYPFVDLGGREILVPSPASFSDMTSGPAAQASVAKVAAELARDLAKGHADRSDAQRILSEAARGAAVDARNLAQEHRNHAGTHEANARYWAELAQSSGQSTSEDREIVEQLAGEVADNAALVAQDALDAAASAALAATFDPNLFDKKSDTLASSRLEGMIDPARIPVLVGQTPVVSTGGIANLTTTQQNGIRPGTLVATMDGRRWVYSGSGTKNVEANYIEQGDVTPVWSVIADKPSFFPSNIVNVAGLQSALDGKSNVGHGHGWDELTGKPSTYPATGHSHPIGNVDGLQNALDGKLNSSFPLYGGTLTGPNMATTTSGIGWRQKDASGVSGVAMLHYKDSDNFYYLLTNRDDANGSYNGLRPLVLNLNNGSITMHHGLTVNGYLNVNGSAVWTAANFNPADKASAVHSHDWAQVTGKPLIAVYLQASTSAQVRADDTNGNRRAHLYGDPDGWGLLNPVPGGGWSLRATLSGLYFTTSGTERTVWHSGNFNPATKADANNWTNVAANVVVTGQKQFRNFATGTIGDGTTGGGASLEVLGNGGAAFMSFHRPGAFATFLGLDTDNRLKIGGWSYGGTSDHIWHSGNIPNDKWQTSVDGQNRFYFSTDGNTYFGAYNNASFRFRNNATGGDAFTVSVAGAANLASTLVAQGGIYTNGNEVSIRGSSPTLYLRDTDNRSGMIHMNSNTMHFLRGAGNDTSAWETVNGRWPLTINFETNDATFGGSIDARTEIYAGGNLWSSASVYSGVGHWFRVRGTNSGIYWENHGGGFHMSDNDWVRVYNGKSFYCSAQVRANTVVGESDRRLKTNIAPITDAMSKVRALEGVTFDWIASGMASLGFIAQDLETVLPTLVTEDADGIKGVQYGPVVALLVEALKDADARIAVLEGRV